MPRLVCECACNACCSGAAGCFESLRPRARATEKTYKQRAQPPRPRDRPLLLRFARISRLPMRGRRSQFASAVICLLCGRLLVEGMLRRSLGMVLQMLGRLLLYPFTIAITPLYPSWPWPPIEFLGLRSAFARS